MSNPSPGFRDRPEHTITVRPLGRRVTVTSDGTTLASSERALALKEHTYPEVIYVPFADIDPELHLAVTQRAQVPVVGYSPPPPAWGGPPAQADRMADASISRTTPKERRVPEYRASTSLFFMVSSCRG